MDYEEWKNVRAIYEHFKSNFAEQIETDKLNKRRKL